MSVKSNLRNSNIEFLRICAMLMIIGLHYLHGSMGGALEYIEYGSWNYYVSQVAETVCIISVNIFVLITGYYMVSRKSNYEIGISKPINLYIIMAFYGFLFLGIFFDFFDYQQYQPQDNNDFKNFHNHSPPLHRLICVCGPHL